jgi:peptidoglycan/LPS O-acetylase OafA/YrhL
MGIIRFLLAISVVMDHAGPVLGFRFVGGAVAVQAFYIISGFYMSLILNEKYIGENNSYKLFITNRFLRIYPLYWCILLLAFALYIIVFMSGTERVYSVLGSYFSVYSDILTFFYLISSNLIIFGQDAVVFLGINPADGHLFFTSDFALTNPKVYRFLFVPQAWSMALELMFYIFAPFILKKGFKPITVLITASLLLRCVLFNAYDLSQDPWTYRFFPTELVFFLLGYVSYRVYLYSQRMQISQIADRLILFIMIVFTLTYSFIPVFTIPYIPFSSNQIVYFGAITLSIPFIFNFLKRNSIDKYIGELSYPIYVSHFFVLTCCHLQSYMLLKSAYVVVLLTIIFSYILNLVLTKPIEEYRQSRLR